MSVCFHPFGIVCFNPFCRRQYYIGSAHTLYCHPWGGRSHFTFHFTFRHGTWTFSMFSRWVTTDWCQILSQYCRWSYLPTCSNTPTQGCIIKLPRWSHNWVRGPSFASCQLFKFESLFYWVCKVLSVQQERLSSQGMSACTPVVWFVLIVVETRILAEMKIENRGKYIFHGNTFFFYQIKMMDLWMQIEGTGPIFVMNFNVHVPPPLLEISSFFFISNSRFC